MAKGRKEEEVIREADKIEVLISGGNILLKKSLDSNPLLLLIK
jgi:hypothetical protein